MDKAIEQISRKLILNRYSKNTQEVYLSCLKKYFQWLSPKIPEEGKRDDIENYLLLLISKEYSKSSQNQYINAIKFYYEKILHQERTFYHFDRPIKDKKLPDILTKCEILSLINTSSNLKHRTIIILLYSCGLRVGELLNLRLSDIDSKQMIIRIKEAKGNKDRNIPLTEAILNQLRLYYKTYRPHTYLFNGQNKPQYSRISINKFIQRYALKAGIDKKVTSHKLRHSYATHMLEAGVDIRYIQTLLGHHRIETTTIYTHVSRKKLQDLYNVLDDLTI